MRLLCKWAKSNFHGLLSSNSCQKSNGHHGDPRSLGLSLLLCRWLINVIQDHSQTEPESSCVSSVQVQVTTFPNSDPPCVLRSLLPKASEVSVYLLQIQIQPRDPTLFIFPPSNGLKGSFAEFYIFFFLTVASSSVVRRYKKSWGLCVFESERERMHVCVQVRVFLFGGWPSCHLLVWSLSEEVTTGPEHWANFTTRSLLSWMKSGEIPSSVNVWAIFIFQRENKVQILLQRIKERSNSSPSATSPSYHLSNLLSIFSVPLFPVQDSVSLVDTM